MIRPAKPGDPAAKIAELTILPCRFELISSRVSMSVIHGWHTCRLLKFGNSLFALAKRPWDLGRIRVTPETPTYPPWSPVGTWSQEKGLLFSRLPGKGRWKLDGTLPPGPYTMAAGPDGTLWFGAASWWTRTEVYRTARPLDIGTLQHVQDGTCSYLSAAVSPEGNYLILFADDVERHCTGRKTYSPNAVTAAFYEKKTDRWYRSRIITPEGRYGYEGIILRGRRAICILQSSLVDRKAKPKPPHFSWRHIRLAKCDDLRYGKWVNKPWLVQPYGDTWLLDLMVGPDKGLYLNYIYRGGRDRREVERRPVAHYIARINDDLKTDIYPTGLAVGNPSLLLADSRGQWYLLTRPEPDGCLRLRELDAKRGFKPGAREYVIGDSEKLQAYVVHTLRPERFGGESDGDAVHLVTTEALKTKTGGQSRYARLWHAFFKLPAGGRARPFSPGSPAPAHLRTSSAGSRAWRNTPELPARAGRRGISR